MRYRYIVGLVALLLLGAGTAVGIAASTGTVSVCASVTGALHTVAVDGNPSTTVGGDTATNCATTTYAIPDPVTTTQTVTVTQTTTTTPPPASGGTAGIGVLDESGHLANLANPNQFSLMVGGAWGADLPVIEGAAGRGLVYFDGTDVQSSYSTGVPYSQASANGWLLKDSAGNLLVNSTYGSYCADVGSSAYQQAWIANVQSYLSSHAGVDGIFIDNVLYDPKGDCGAYPAKYPTTATWDTAMVSFVKAVYTSLTANGYYVALNAGAYKSGDTAYNDGTSTVNWWKQVGPYASGLTNEYYDETSDGTYRVRTSGTAWYQDFDSWQRLIGTAQGMGDDFIGLTYGANDAATMTYGKASFLLEWNGGGSAFVYKITGSSADPSNTAWTSSVGTPTGAKFAVGVGYERAYTGGTVLLNPSPTASQTFTANGSSYTLAPTTARILINP